MSDYSAIIEPLSEAFAHVDKLVAFFPELASLTEGRKLFRLMRADEILDVRKQLGAIAEVHNNLIFPFTNDAGDYFGVWIAGLAYSWAWYRHDEADLIPVIRDTRRLKLALAASAGAADLPASVHDYPDLGGTGTEDDIERDRQLVAFFRQELGGRPPTHDDPNAWFNFSVVTQMTPKADIDALVEYLDSPDQWVQERAVVILGQHRHPPARAKIEAIAASGTGNGRLAAESVLARWGTQGR